jgi:short-subunit dehydrogenase involved in D-alanine esterification of teichoic acids
MYTTSGLVLVPILRGSKYCATKAAPHNFILCLRRQLQGSKIKVVEIFALAVQLELHDERHRPDIKNGHLIGIPLDEFTEETYRGLVQSKDQIPVGMSQSLRSLRE